MAKRIAEARRQGRIDYFDAFQRMADLAVEEADLLLATVEDFPGAEALGGRLAEAHRAEAASDAIVADILRTADGDFVTPVERNDIVELAMAVDEVTDELEKVVKHLHMYDVASVEPQAVEMCRIVYEECAVMQEAMHPFRDFKKPKKLVRYAKRIDELEDEVDGLYHDAVRALFTGDGDPRHVMKWRAIYSTIEECSDYVERAADLMTRIVVNNS